MSSYLYHAPDGERYGPVDRATLEQWLAQGRLVPESRIEVKSRGEIVTLAALLAEPPPALVLEDVVVDAPVAEDHASPSQNALHPPPSFQSFAHACARAIQLTGLPVVLVALSVNAFTLLLTLALHSAEKPVGGEQSLSLTITALTVAGVALVLNEWMWATLVVFVHRRLSGEPARLDQVARETARCLGSLLINWGLRALAVFLVVLATATLLILGAAAGKQLSLGVAFLCLLLGVLVGLAGAYACCWFTIAPQAIVLERLPAWQAMGRSRELMERRTGNSIFARGTVWVMGALLVLFVILAFGITLWAVGSGILSAGTSANDALQQRLNEPWLQALVATVLMPVLAWGAAALSCSLGLGRE